MGRIHNIEGKKNKMDSLRSSAFTKHARNITVAARMGGGDPAYNATLKLAIEKAKADNMPNDNIKRAINKGIGATDGANYEHITYEGYGPGGVALIIECLTDNKNRTAGNVRHHLERSGGNLGTAGCVSFMFERKGAIAINKEGCPMDEDGLMELALEAGAEDFTSEDTYYEIITEPDAYSDVRDALDEAGVPVMSGDITMLPATYTEVPADKKKSLQKLLDALDEDDDIQNVYDNMAR
jgi:YebC/PmpR family DNA-binding regulatory protein